VGWSGPNGVRSAATEAVDAKKEIESTRNGIQRATEKSRPPMAGPIRRTACVRPVIWANAVGSSAAGTRRRIVGWNAAIVSPLTRPWSSPTTATRITVTWPVSTAHTMVATATA